jgi:hypothetical protein
VLRRHVLDQEFVEDRVATFDPVQLGATKPGQVASDIYERLRSLQGRNGPLISRQLQKHITWANADKLPLAIGYLSPDGEIGPAQWAQERETPSPRPDRLTEELEARTNAPPNHLDESDY